MDAAPPKDPVVRFRRDVFDRLVEPRGYLTGQQKADLIGCGRSTFWRVSRGITTPSPEFMAGVTAALPGVPMETVFDFGPSRDRAA